ncbi:MAG: SelT/SelW/SelH family protein [Opitutae bacterium]|jgi:selenoprotein W-related protein|nr:SelT/SelW/SelH family protein [Opitutae bacterium]
MDSEKIMLTVEYCTGCRWLTRASWVAQELLITFEGNIEGVSLKPSVEPGTFRVLSGSRVFWDRKTEGGFPELKVLKQIIRDFVSPEKDLGHSDNED